MKDVFTKKWAKASLVRILKTMAETAASLLTASGIGIMDVDWVSLASVTALSGVYTALTCIKGLPEVKE